MKNTIYILLLLLLFGVLSCREPYEDNIITGKQVLVVDGLLSNNPGGTYVTLSLATSYNSVVAGSSVHNARVFITDNTDSVFAFQENSPGRYTPVNTSFAGVVNKTYTLAVETTDGQVYVSKPETMMPPLAPVKVYGGFNTEEQLVENLDGATTKTVKDICDIYFDYIGSNNVTPRFRYTSSQLIEYIIDKTVGLTSYIFYCWITQADNTLRFTNEKYPSTSGEVKKQTACITPGSRVISVRDMDIKTLNYKDSLVNTLEYKRIVRISQYRLNNDSYTWYKGVESQSAAEGKMFDPLTTQLYGNMTCKTDATRTVLGFFEVSSVATNSYSVSRNVIGGPVGITGVPNISTTGSGFRVDTIPDNWIQ
jgi:hypothetical protein